MEHYHSYQTAQYLFGSIYRSILHGEEIELMDLFHPLKSAYRQQFSAVEHPLHENRLPEQWYP